MRIARAVSFGLALLAGLVLLAPAPLWAQRGYRVDPPIGQVTVAPTLGVVIPTGAFWDFARRTQTLDRALPSLGVTGEIAVRLSPRQRLFLESGFHTTGTIETAAVGLRPGELFYEVLPTGRERLVEQSTRLTQVPLRVGVAWERGADGRRVGSLAWRPATGWRPMADVALGMQWTTLRQQGDYVDRADTSVFTASYRSRSVHLSGRAGLGVRRNFGPHTVLQTRADLSLAPWRVQGDFRGFDTGWLVQPAIQAGLSFRF